VPIIKSAGVLHFGSELRLRDDDFEFVLLSPGIVEHKDARTRASVRRRWPKI
jgi:hypothetical protein